MTDLPPARGSPKAQIIESMTEIDIFDLEAKCAFLFVYFLILILILIESWF